MTTYSIAQLEQYAEQAGWPSSAVPTFAAIEEAESSGNPNAIGPGGSWGLAQIQPQYHTGMAQTSDPVQQDQDALQIYQAAGNSFAPWSTWTEGTYKQYLAQAQSALGTVSSPSPSAATPSSSGSCVNGKWTDAQGSDIGTAVGNWWGSFSCSIGAAAGKGVTASQIALGMIVIAGGIGFMLWQTNTGKQIVAQVRSTAGKVARDARTAAEVAAL